MEGNQWGGGQHPLLLQLPHQAAVGVVLQACELLGQGAGGLGPQAPAVIEVEPAALMQGSKHLLGVGAVELEHHVAEGGGAGFDLDQGP